MPGNAFVPAGAGGLPADSVGNVPALVTLDKTDLGGVIGRRSAAPLREADRGLRRVPRL
jgi:mRNA interferase MazF